VLEIRLLGYTYYYMIRAVRKTLLVLWLSSMGAGIATAGDDYPRLSDSADSLLQKKLNQKLDKLGLHAAIKQGSLSVALVNITDPQHPHFAAINGNKMMYAASMPKVAILFGALKRIERGEMTLDRKTRKELVSMIRYSSNRAATNMLNKVGKQYLANLLQSPRYHLYDRKYNGGLWVGKAYSSSGAWKRDPLHNLSHGATAFQTARLYYLLETGQLLNPELSKEMKAILGNPGINHKFVRGLNTHRPGSKIFRKSGSWRAYHADSAIVERNGHRYIAVAIAHNKAGGEWMKRIIVALDDLVIHATPTKVAFLK
jgi:beta-lactamase class A